MNITLKYSHPDLRPDPSGCCTIQDIFYHIVRCGLMHAAELPSTLRFSEESRFRVDNGVLVLPASLVYGLIVAVVVCSVNAGERVSDELGLNVRGFQLKLNTVWGKKQQLLNLFAAMEAF